LALMDPGLRIWAFVIKSSESCVGSVMVNEVKVISI
jgi:hypothetical protein